MKERWAPARAFETFPRDPQPLVRIYRLDRSRVPDEDARVERLSRRAGLMELVASTFRFDFADRTRLAIEFDNWSRLIEALPVFRLLVADDLENVRAMDVVTAHLQRL